jgi:hypothetical protein
MAATLERSSDAEAISRLTFSISLLDNSSEVRSRDDREFRPEDVI